MARLYEWDEELLFKSRTFVKMSTQVTENLASKVIIQLCWKNRNSVHQRSVKKKKPLYLEECKSYLSIFIS